MRPFGTAVLLVVAGCASHGAVHPSAAERPPATPSRDLLSRADALVVRLETGDVTPEACEFTAASLSSLAASLPARAVDVAHLHARALLACGRQEDARAALRRALALDPGHGPSLVLASRLDRHEGRLDDADRLVRRAITERPGDVDALVELAMVLRDRRSDAALEEAEGVLSRALSIDPTRVDAHNALAQVYLAQASERPQRLELATAACRRAAEIDPSYAAVHTTWGQIDLRKGYAATASAHFERAMTLDRRSVEPRLAFGSLAVTLGAFEDARRALEEAVAIDERNYDAHVYLAVALGELRRDPDARRALRRAQDLDPARPEAYFHLGRIEATSSDPSDREDARRNLERFLERASGPGVGTSAVEQARRLLDDMVPRHP